MVALIVISSIVFYAFIVVVAYYVTVEKLYKHCGCEDNRWSSCDHEFPAGILAMFWPVSYAFWGLIFSLHRAGVAVAEFLTKER